MMRPLLFLLLSAACSGAVAQTTPFYPARNWVWGTPTGVFPESVAYGPNIYYAEGDGPPCYNGPYGSIDGSGCLYVSLAKLYGGWGWVGGIHSWDLTTNLRGPFAQQAPPTAGQAYKFCATQYEKWNGGYDFTVENVDCDADANYVLEAFTWADCPNRAGDLEKAYWKTTVASGNPITGVVPTGTTPPFNSCSRGCVVQFRSLSGNVWSRPGEGYTSGADIWVEMDVQVSPVQCKQGDTTDEYYDAPQPPSTACLPQQCATGSGSGAGGGGSGGDVSQGSATSSQSNIDAKYAAMVSSMTSREGLFAADGTLSNLFSNWRISSDGSGGTGSNQWFPSWSTLFGIGSAIQPVCKLEGEQFAFAGKQLRVGVDFCNYAEYARTFLQWFFMVIVTVYGWLNVFGARR